MNRAAPRDVRRLDVHHHDIGSAYDSSAEHWLDDRFSSTDRVRQHKRALSFLDDRHGGCSLNAVAAMFQ